MRYVRGMKLPASNAPSLFDRQTLMRRRARVQEDALFLHHAAVDEVQHRLSMVNRSFTAPAIVSPFSRRFGRGSLPDARIAADEETLTLTRGAHDLVVHAMALHWANDPVGQLIQCHRALRADGLLLAVCLGGETLHQLRAAVGQAEIEVTGGLSPRIAPMAELRDLGALLQRAGLALPVADAVPLTAEYRDLTHLMRDLRAMGETNVLTDRLKSPTRRQVFVSRATDLCRSLCHARGSPARNFRPDLPDQLVAGCQPTPTPAPGVSQDAPCRRFGH